MKTCIEITGLTPKIDPATLQMKSGVIMAFKKEDGKADQFDMDISQMELMETLKIRNMSEAVWQKYDIETDDRWKITSIVPKDTRQVTYADYERLQNGINKIISLLSNQQKAK